MEIPDAGNGFWGDTRIEVNSYISDQWKNEISNGRWLHGGSGLFSQLVGGTKSGTMKNALLSGTEISSENELIVYPNPATGEITISGLEEKWVLYDL